MKKRILSVLLVASILISGTTTQLYANTQIQVKKVVIDEIFYVPGQDIITGKTIIRPTMTVSWQDPAAWEDNADPALIHEPDYYDIVVTNLTQTTTSTIRVNKGSEEFTDKKIDIHEKINLVAGVFYNVEVKPFHYHTNIDGTKVIAPSSGTPENAYAITDLNVKFVTTESSVQVIWDDLGMQDFEYRIVYALGDFTNKSKQQIIDNKEGEIAGIRFDSDNVQRFYDPVERRNKLAYTISERIYPGQVYSIMVEPTVYSYNGEPVTSNINFPVIRSCSTNVQLDLFEEGDYIRLEWDIPPSFKVGQNQDEYELVEATLQQFKDGQSSNVVVFDGDAAKIGYYKIEKPIRETAYQIKFLYKAVADQSKPAIEPVSNLAVYVPSDLMITPTKPIVPSVFSQSLINELRLEGKSDDQIRIILQEKYFVSGYTYAGKLNDLATLNNTYQIITSAQDINFVWGAFQRLDVDETSPTYKSLIYDSNIYYDIWVTESLEATAYAPKAIDDRRYGVGTAGNNITDGTKIFGYKETLNMYYDEEEGEMSPIVPGKLYYIKIVAKKKTGNNELVSEATIVPLYYMYNGDAYEPPSIAKPPLEVKESATTDNSVTITWEEAWWEIISLGADENHSLYTWKHEVWVSDDGTIFDEKTAGTRYFPIYNGENVIAELKKYLKEDCGVDQTEIDLITGREVDLGKDDFNLSDIKYKFLKIPYAQVKSTIEARQLVDSDYSFQEYYEEMIKEDKNDTKPLAWKNVLPTLDTENPQKLIYEEKGLLPNTTYLFMLYPYRELNNGNVLYAHYPTPIIVSTEPEEGEVNPDPTVPSLYISDYKDTNITVAWKYNKDFTYELVYSIFDDVTTAKPVTWSMSTDPLNPKYPVNGELYEVLVDDLFPNTQYYFWVRATQPVTSKTSHWSNPALQKTRDVDNPYPPKGFGIASLENMKKFNYDAAVTKDYIAVEWVLDDLDVVQDMGKAINKTYTYILEVSDNAAFIDPLYIESSGGTKDIKPNDVELLKKNLIKINKLIPNRAYYLRVKTRVTVTGKEQGQLINKESVGYSSTIKIITSSTGDEYDGTIDPELEVLPTEDYEIIYNKKNQELTFRFRDNEVDADGNKDNNVDQRLISNLIAQNVYVYNIDISEYQNKTIAKRSVSIPYSIVEAFDTHKIKLSIDAGDVILEVPYGALTSEVKEQTKLYGGVPSVRIEIKSLGKNYTKEQMPNQSIREVTESQNIGIYVDSKNKNTALNFTDKELIIQLLTNNKYEQFRVNRIGTVKDYQNNWNTLESTYDSDSGFMTFKTSRIGVYNGYVIENTNSSYIANKSHWSEVYRNLVIANYSIKGLNNYNADHKITEEKLINIVYAIIAGKKEVDLDGYISKDIITALTSSKTKTNLSTTKTQITREEAISMFVRAYEIINEETIIPSNTTINAVNRNANISSGYKASMAKASTIGMISSLEQARPKDAITYGEVFAVWSKLIN
ncbi:MAG: hypothetical protein CVV02_06375 [Firmicutes bacterium HGW-Firmicutes-7]|nr:MAG: hypothetical protein CVV02_06375 [Firmicutes bacterium HGW-Firmicutes-7]